MLTLKKKYGKWSVIGVEIFDGKNYRIPCKCVCGTVRNVCYPGLHSGRSTNCGCYRQTEEYRQPIRERLTRHGRTKTPIHNAWVRMRDRCENPTNKSYADYGGRGITVCKRWGVFENFLTDMGERPSPKHSLDRIDNDKGYSPKNCRWATRTEQNNNQRVRKDALLVTYKGETKPLIIFARELGIPYGRAKCRYRFGMSIDKVLDPKPISGYESRAVKRNG